MVEQTMSHRIGLHWSAFHCPLFCPSLHLYDDEDSGCLLHQVSRGLGSLWQDVLGSGNSNRRPTMGHVDVTKHLLRSRLPQDYQSMPRSWPSAFDDNFRQFPNGLQLTSGQTNEQIVIAHDGVITWHTDGRISSWKFRLAQ